jgi:AraC-like DNA-binding protein
MQHKELEAPEELRNMIQGFWYLEKDFGALPSAFEVLPDGHAEIIFYVGSGCSMLQEGNPVLLPSPFIVGLLGQPTHFYAKDRLCIIGVRCFPWAIYDLLKLSAANGGGVRGLAHPIALLQTNLNELIGAGKADEALALVREWFMNARSELTPSATLTKAGMAMLEANGTLPVSSVAAAAHATVRTLERKFKASSGHTVKNVSGLMRFEQVRDHLWRNPDVNIASLANEFAYADQSHLNREFKRYSGMTVAAFARQAKLRKKIFDGDFVAIVLSS